MRLGAPGFGILVAVSTVGAFIGLDASSFWLDELFSAYFSDPRQTSLLALLLRAAEDVHPPIYYVLLYFVAQLPGDFVIVARGLSAVLAVISLGMLYIALPKNLSMTARLAACAFGATSITWSWYSQEVRAYALCFVIVTALINIGLRFLRRLEDGQLPLGLFMSLTATAILGGLIHYYLLLLAGGIIGALLIASTNWSQRGLIVASGFSILIPVSAFVIWHLPQIVPNTSKIWFSTDPTFLMGQLIEGSKHVFGSWPGLLLMSALLCAVLFLNSRAPILGSVFALIRGPIGLIIVVPLIGIILVIGISLTIQPIFSARFFVILSPFAWAFFGFLINAVFDQRLLAGPVLIASVALLLAANSEVLWRHLPAKEEWRDSATFIEGLENCKGETIPVVTIDQNYITDNEAKRFYGYYMRNRDSYEFLELRRNRIMEELTAGSWAEIIQQRLLAEDDCPVLLWSVHHLNAEKASRLVETMRQSFQVPEGKQIEARHFTVPLPPTIPFGVPATRMMQTVVIGVWDKVGTPSSR
jgi:hypothetical protein